MWLNVINLVMSNKDLMLFLKEVNEKNRQHEMEMFKLQMQSQMEMQLHMMRHFLQVKAMECKASFHIQICLVPLFKAMTIKQTIFSAELLDPSRERTYINLQ